MSQQPNNFGFGEDEAMLRDSARRFFTDNLSADKLHQLVAQDHDPHRANECVWDAELWQQAAELGWMAACIPEAKGGIGMPLVAAVALVEEAGRAGFPSPMVATYQASFLLQACGTAAADDVLLKIAEGTAFSLALTNQRGDVESTDVQVNSDGTLSGSSYFVQEARKVTGFIVSGQTAKGTGLYLVEASAANIVPDTIVDLTRDQATLHFDNTAAIELCAPGDGEAALSAALPAMLCVASADLVGGAEWLLQTTAEYSRTRVQFDRQLGFFQAIKHPLVNAMVQIDNAKSLTYNAACGIDVGDKQALQLARMAKSEASDAAVYAASRAVQFHGGIGFTWECYVQVFFKRVMHGSVLLGDARYQRSKLAEVLVGPIAA